MVVVLNNFKESRQAAKTISAKLNDPQLEVMPWQEVERPFYRAMMADKEGMWISLMIIIVIVAIGVLNTVLMSILERTREYGVLKALGTRPWALFKLILLETSFLAGLAVIIGTILSLGINYYMSIHGIAYPEGMDMGGIVITTMQGVINVRCLLIPAVVTFFTSVLVSIIPALRAVHIKPVRAIRL
jgi:ABC-type lipoprotein release transport system permease subunit